MAHEPVLTVTREGIYCPSGRFHIDPWRPVERALITHAHADHARAGHKLYLCSQACAPVLRHRLGAIKIETIAYANERQINDVRVSFHPAGHVPGSAQIRVERNGEIWVVSGDYKTEDDGLSEPFEPVLCHTFITESTFGLPHFRWPLQSRTAEELNSWWQTCLAEGKTPILGAYSFGKAQRLLSMLDQSIGPILTHPAIEGTTQVLRHQGYKLPQTQSMAADIDEAPRPNSLVIATPAAMNGKWGSRFGPTSTAFASGWMQTRKARKQRSVDQGFTLSDHADWTGLNAAILATQAQHVLVTHGDARPLAKWLTEQGLSADVLKTDFATDSPNAEKTL